MSFVLQIVGARCVFCVFSNMTGKIGLYYSVYFGAFPKAGDLCRFAKYVK